MRSAVNHSFGFRKHHVTSWSLGLPDDESIAQCSFAWRASHLGERELPLITSANILDFFLVPIWI